MHAHILAPQHVLHCGNIDRVQFYAARHRLGGSHPRALPCDCTASHVAVAACAILSPPMARPATNNPATLWGNMQRYGMCMYRPVVGRMSTP